MPNEKLIYWDSCVFISRIQRTQERIEVLEQIAQGAAKGELKIVTSILAKGEVAHLGKTDLLPEQQEHRIIEFFDNDFIVVQPLDDWICDEARRLARRFHGGGRRGADYIHLATAVVHRVPVFHTYDGKLLDLNSQIDGLSLRVPQYEGNVALPFDGETADEETG